MRGLAHTQGSLGNDVCATATSVCGTFETSRRIPTMSVYRGRPEAAGTRSKRRFRPECNIDDSRKILRHPPPDPFQGPKATDYDVAPIVELEWRSDMRQKF